MSAAKDQLLDWYHRSPMAYNKAGSKLLFNELPDEMRWGVYQKFYAEQHIFICVNPPEPLRGKLASVSVTAAVDLEDYHKRDRGMTFTSVKSLDLAWKKAIEGAENLFNELRA